MLYVIPGSRNCGVRNDFSVWRNGKCIHNDPHKPVTIKLFAKEVTRMPAWFWCIAKVGRVDEFDIAHLHFVHVPLLRSSFPWVANYDKPKVVFGHYRVVPGFPSIAIDKHAIAIDPITGEKFKVYVSARGYSFIHATIGSHNFRSMVPLHRAVALAWIHNPDPKNQVIVNHIDGKTKPLSNDATNLEWVTPSGNIRHAVRTGLMTFAKPCRIRSIKTGEVKMFPSIAEMSEFLDIKVTKEASYFNHRRGNKLFKGEWEVRLDGDNRPWIYEQKCQNVEPSRYIFTITEPGKEPIIHNGLRSVIWTYKLWNLPSWSCKEVLKRFKHDYPNYKIEVKDQYNLRPIEVKNLETGEVKVYASNKELHEKTGWCKTAVLDAINYAGHRRLYGKYVLRRQTNKPWPTDIRVTMNRPVEVEITNKQTQKVTKCKSLRDAARFIGTIRSNIKRMHRKPRKTDRYIVTIKTPASSENR